jgi:hypothetical protein
MCRLVILYSISHFMLCQPFHIVLAISYCANHFTYFVSHSMFRAAILYRVSHFCVVSAISCFASHFHIVYILYILSVILLVSNVPILASTPRCQFFTSDVIDKISILDREVSRDGSMTFGKLPVSKTCFVSAFNHYCHFIVKTV